MLPTPLRAITIYLTNVFRNFRLAAIPLLFLTFGILAPNRLQAGGNLEEIDGVTVITVVVPSLPKPTDTSVPIRAEVAVIQQFEKDFPEIFRRKHLEEYRADPKKYGIHNWSKVAVRLVPFSRIQIEGVESDLMAIAGGNPPDVLFVNFRKSDNYIRNGFLYPLDKMGDGYMEALSQEEIDGRVHPKIWPVIRRKGPQGEEHIWALPVGGFLGRVLAYRKDLFDEAGIPYPNADWTWEDMLDAAKKLTDPARGKTGILLGGEAGWQFTSFLWSAGGEVMEYDAETGEWKCLFGSREAAVALDYYLRLTLEAWQPTTGPSMRGYAFLDRSLGLLKWERGEIGMNFITVDEKFFSGLNPELVGLAPAPKGPTGIRAAELNSRMLGLFSQIKHPAVRDAAWEYILYQDSEEAAALRTKILVEGGLGRFINPAQLARFGYPEVARLAPKGWAETFQITSDTGRPEPYGRNSNLAYRLLARPVDEASQLALRYALPEDREARLDLLEKLLRDAEVKANQLMMGKVAPEERQTRNITAALFLICMVAGFIFVFTRVLRSFGTSPATTRKGSRRGGVIVFLLLAPALISFVLWKYYPLFVGSVMGFQDYRLLGKSTWVGLTHFGDVLWDDMWWHSLWNSLRFSFLALTFGFLPPVVLAILLQEVPKGKVLYRLLFYLPAVLAGLVTLLLWKQFYDPSPNGALNMLVLRLPAIVYLALGLLILWGTSVLARRFSFHGQGAACGFSWIIGLVFAASIAGIAWPIFSHSGFAGLFQTLSEPAQWLRDPRYAMIACIIPGIWAGMGPGCLIYLAALKGIPDDYYEAADIDGATFLDKIISIVLPMMRPLLIINFVGAFIGSWLNSSDTILAMTAGQADTEVAPLSIFYKAFVYLEFGPATAMAWMLGFLLIGFTVYQLKMLARVEFRATGNK